MPIPSYFFLFKGHLQKYVRFRATKSTFKKGAEAKEKKHIQIKFISFLKLCPNHALGRSSRPEVFCKKGVRKFREKYLCQSLFIKKETPAQAFSCEFCEISKNTPYHRTPLVTASI